MAMGRGSEPRLGHLVSKKPRDRAAGEDAIHARLVMHPSSCTPRMHAPLCAPQAPSQSTLALLKTLNRQCAVAC